MWLNAIVFLGVIVSVIGQAPTPPPCPDNCSNHGRCVNSVCMCDSGYMATDCSIKLTTLAADTPVSSSLLPWNWDYYTFQTATSSSSFKVTITAMDTNFSDCDVYIKKDQLPTAAEWDYSNTDWGTNGEVTVLDAQFAHWYIGVIASFVRCSYEIKVHETGSCPAGCVHGTCSNSICTCNPDYSGIDCSIQTAPILLNDRVTGSVGAGAWDYRFLDLTTTVTAMVVEFNITNDPVIGHDCDFFVKYGSAPNLLDWTYQDSSIGNYFQLEIPIPAIGKWYFGVWGFQTCSFLYNVRAVTNVCVSECSRHGQCGPPCHCNADYLGDYCENKTTPLLKGEVAIGFLDQNIWNYYKYHADSSQDNIVITVNQSEPTGDIDLYIKLDKDPSRFEYDFIDISTTQNFQFVVYGVVDRTLHIGLFGWVKSPYQMTITTTEACTSECVHGRCSRGVCVCDAGWYGEACSTQDSNMASGDLAQGTITGPGQWKFYHFHSTGRTVDITLKESVDAQAGLLFLFVAENREPSLRVNDFQDTDLNAKLRSILIKLDDRQTVPTDWVIGVYGSTYVTVPVEYQLTVWEA
eukprot:TRINITY_DN2907_c0_g1_i1.p1 TRINITY_DN2907_c0_g1~~TRINITY_DN2907_c0_g1_i1.p1  ORF type:complete len:576 (-),score=72.58 TRINITY_DN2907_c0_g1_i1:21-1748(-)